MDLSRAINEEPLRIRFKDKLNEHQDKILSISSTSPYPVSRTQIEFCIDKRTNLRVIARFLSLDEQGLLPFIEGKVASDFVHIKRDDMEISRIGDLGDLLYNHYDMAFNEFYYVIREKKKDGNFYELMHLIGKDFIEKKVKYSHIFDDLNEGWKYRFSLYEDDVYNLCKRLRELINTLSLK